MSYKQTRYSLSPRGDVPRVAGSGAFTYFTKSTRSTFSSLPSVLTRLKKSLKPAKEGFSQLTKTKECWVDLVGPHLARDTCPFSLKEGCLEVRVRSAVARSALLSAKKLILQRYQHLNLDLGWQEITVRLGRF